MHECLCGIMSACVVSRWLLLLGEESLCGCGAAGVSVGGMCACAHSVPSLQAHPGLHSCSTSLYLNCMMWGIYSTTLYFSCVILSICSTVMQIIVLQLLNNNNNKRPLTPKSMPPAGDEHAKLQLLDVGYMQYISLL